ncbi:MAG TPA: D-alanyl-D-alanine carboxypeptidase family protein [Opitutaceae bacterium]
MPLASSVTRLLVLFLTCGGILCAAADYKGAIVIDADTGRTIIEDNADVVSPPASVTKLMTFLIVHDRLAAGTLTLQTPVHVNAEASTTGGSQVYLAEKEVFPVEDMLYALMISSANDAAAALAIHVAGSRAAFVELMNAKARELGMTHTTFRSPHGLPPANRKIADGDLTSPRDLATLSRHLITQTDVIKYTEVKVRMFRPGPKQIEMRNHNNLLGKVAGVDGLKTGFTRGAGFCLAATAQRNGRRIIVVTMGSAESKVRDLAVADLIEKGFAALPAMPVLSIPGASPAPAAAAQAGTTKGVAPTRPATSPAPAPASGASPVITPAPAAPADEPPPVRFVLPGKKG